MKKDMKLNRILMILGFSADKIGFHYIIQAVEFLNKQKIHVNLSTVYEKVYKKNKKIATEYAVERNIRYAIESAYKRNPIFKKIYAKKPLNGEFLYDLVFNKDVFIDTIEKYCYL